MSRLVEDLSGPLEWAVGLPFLPAHRTLPAPGLSAPLCLNKEGPMGAMAKSPAHERAMEMLLAGDFPRYEEDVIQ